MIVFTKPHRKRHHRAKRQKSDQLNNKDCTLLPSDTVSNWDVGSRCARCAPETRGVKGIAETRLSSGMLGTWYLKRKPNEPHSMSTDFRFRN